MDVPDVSYARSGDMAIAYQVVGAGPVDLVFAPLLSNLHHIWKQPLFAHFLGRLAGFSRLILLDKRGSGLSDRPRVPTLEAQMDDVRAVLDAVDSERAALFGAHAGGQMCALFGATYPERTTALVLFNTPVRGFPAGDEPEPLLEDVRQNWGTRDFAERLTWRVNPTLAGDREYLDWFVWSNRLAASPGAAYAFYRMLQDTDIRDVLPAVRVPTLVLYRANRRDSALEIARAIPAARAVEVPGLDSAPFIGDEPIVETERFLTGLVVEPVSDRVLTTVLFTDIVGSTRHAAALGDRAWRDLLDRHHSAVRGALARFRGQELDTAGDGFFATFDGPARAIRCAQAVVEDVSTLGLELRVGVHTGECELQDGKVAGLAVSIGSRVTAAAQPGEVLVSSTVKDLVAGSGIGFADRGIHDLKGVPGTWRIYAVVDD